MKLENITSYGCNYTGVSFCSKIRFGKGVGSNFTKTSSAVNRSGVRGCADYWGGAWSKFDKWV